MSNTVVDIFEKPGVPYSTSADVYSTTSIGVAAPTIELDSVVNPPVGGGEPSSEPLVIEFESGDPIPDPPVMVPDVPITPIDVSTHFRGGPVPRVYSVFSGTLPAGLVLSSAGIVSGTPTGAGTSAIVFRGTDNAGNHANSNSVTFTVAALSTMLLHFETVGPAAIVDSSLNNFTLTKVPDMETNITGVKWGSRAGFNSAGALVTQSSPLLAPGAGDFLYNMWVRPSNNIGFNNRTLFTTKYTGGGSGSGFSVYSARPPGGSDYRVSVIDNAGVPHNSPSQNQLDNTQYFVAIARKAGIIYVQVDSVVVFSYADATDFTNTVTALFNEVGGAGQFNGAIDEFQYIKGYAPVMPMAIPTGPYTS